MSEINQKPDKVALNRAWNYRRNIVARIDAQTTKGIEKYGQTLEFNPAGITERLEHLAQELTDGLAYIEWVKEGLSKTCSTCGRATIDLPSMKVTNCHLPTPQFTKCACNPEHYKWIPRDTKEGSEQCHTFTSPA